MDYKTDFMLDEAIKEFEEKKHTPSGFMLTTFLEVNFDKVEELLKVAKNTKDSGYSKLADIIKTQFLSEIKPSVIRSTFYRVRKRKLENKQGVGQTR